MDEFIGPHAYDTVLAELRKRLNAEPSHRAQLLTGPRQVGKTTLLLALASEKGERALYAAADTPEAALAGWWENLWHRAQQLAAGGSAMLLLDEIQYLDNWQRLLKSKMDQLKRARLPLHVVATGSSALGLGHGSRETMAGRFERLRLLHWPASEVVRCFRLDPLVAARRTVGQGSYPGAVPLLDDLIRWRSYVRDSIIEPAIGRDMLAVEAIRKPALLRQVFAIVTGHPAEIISLQKICGQLGSSGALETVAHYLELLEEACLAVALRKYSGKMLRQRAAPPKLIALNNAFLGATTNVLPSPDRDAERWGRWVENACGALAWNCSQQVHYWREEPLELDFVTEGSWGNWAIEVKTGAYSARDLSALLEFCRRNPRFQPLVVCDRAREAVAQAAGVRSRPWEDFLLEGPPGSK
jgi:hypothetical protein